MESAAQPLPGASPREKAHRHHHLWDPQPLYTPSSQKPLPEPQLQVQRRHGIASWKLVLT